MMAPLPGVSTSSAVPQPVANTGRRELHGNTIRTYTDSSGMGNILKPGTTPYETAANGGSTLQTDNNGQAHF